MGTTNAQQWNNAAINQETDAEYAADALRIGGAPTDAILPSPTFNKLAYQVSTYIAALGQMLANKGISNSDANLPNLIAALSNIITTADQKNPLLLVAYSPTPSINANVASGFYFPLQGNSSITVTGGAPGQLLALYFLQDSVGGRTINFTGSNVLGANEPDPTPNAVSVQLFQYDPYHAIFVAAGPMISSGTANFSGGVEAQDFSVNTTAGGPLFHAYQAGGSYGSSPSTAAFLADTQGAGSNYLFSAALNGAVNFFVQASGFISAVAMTLSGAFQAASAVITGLLNVGSLQIGGAGAAGSVLAGNGTSFVSKTFTLADVTGARAFATNFQNNSGAEMEVYVNMNSVSGVGNGALVTGFAGPSAGAQFTVSLNGVTNSGGKAGVSFRVPPGWFYSATAVPNGGSPTISLYSWVEGTYA